MRVVVYDKINLLSRLCKALREPERSAAESLLTNIYSHISAITYANPIPDEVEATLLFSILIQEKNKKSANIDDLTLYIFTLMILNKAGKWYPNASDLHRLLPAGK